MHIVLSLVRGTTKSYNIDTVLPSLDNATTLSIR
jgi:hypothetical protein